MAAISNRDKKEIRNLIAFKRDYKEWVKQGKPMRKWWSNG